MITAFLIIGGILTYLFIAVIWFGNRYIVKGNALIVKIGSLTERNIDIQKIRSIKRSYSVWAAPAIGLKRLLISYGREQILISPKREITFLEKLKSINPEFELEI